MKNKGQESIFFKADSNPLYSQYSHFSLLFIWIFAIISSAIKIFSTITILMMEN